MSFCRLLLVAGHETSTNLIGNVLLTLTEYPETMDETFNAISTTIESSERELLLEKWPIVNDHQTKTSREIPFVALQREG